MSFLCNLFSHLFSCSQKWSDPSRLLCPETVMMTVNVTFLYINIHHFPCSLCFNQCSLHSLSFTQILVQLNKSFLTYNHFLTPNITSRSRELHGFILCQSVHVLLHSKTESSASSCTFLITSCFAPWLPLIHMVLWTSQWPLPFYFTWYTSSSS